MTITHNNRWLWLAALLLIGWLIYQLSPILSPFLVGILLAYLGDPLVDRLERWKLSRTWGVILVFSLFTLLCLLLLLVLVPMLGKQLMHLYQLAPQGLDWLQLTALPWVQAQFGLAVVSIVRLDHLLLHVSNSGAAFDASTLQSISAYRAQYGVDY